MEEPGLINKKERRVKLLIIILPSCFLLLLFITIFKLSKKETMASSGSVKGILLNSAGLPVANAIIMIQDGDHEFNDMASVSNESGEFFVSNIIIPGRYILRINYNDTQTTREIYVQSSQHTITINL